MRSVLLCKVPKEAPPLMLQSVASNSVHFLHYCFSFFQCSWSVKFPHFSRFRFWKMNFVDTWGCWSCKWIFNHLFKEFSSENLLGLIELIQYQQYFSKKLLSKDENVKFKNMFDISDKIPHSFIVCICFQLSSCNYCVKRYARFLIENKMYFVINL